MSETIEFTELEDQNIVIENARKAYLVSLGAAAYTVTSTADYAKNARTNLGDLTGKLLTRGEETDEKTRSVITKQVETRQKDVQSVSKRFEKAFGKRMESLLHTMNIPSKNDINSLSNKVTRLSKKVNELSKAE